jgi:hypothetical protein
MCFDQCSISVMKEDHSPTRHSTIPSLDLNSWIALKAERWPCSVMLEHCGVNIRNFVSTVGLTCANKASDDVRYWHPIFVSIAVC